MEWILIILGILLTLAGIIGCIIPSIPGPPLNFVALLLFKWAVPDSFDFDFMFTFFIAVISVTAIDYTLPVFGGKAFGVSRYGIWGSMIGMLAGMIFFPPFGMLVGLVAGAIIGELAAGKENSEALKAGIAAFLISIFMIVMKLVLSLIMSYYFFKATITLIFG